MLFKAGKREFQGEHDSLPSLEGLQDACHTKTLGAQRTGEFGEAD
jgi:hypothetical protein